MARPRKSGRRTKSGRLSVSAEALAERNPPAEHILERRRVYSFVQPPAGKRQDGRNGEIDSEVCDGIGQLHVLGLLEDHGHDPAEMVRVGREWGHACAMRHKPLGPKTGSFERRDKSIPSDAITREDIMFERMDRNLWKPIEWEDGEVTFIPTDERRVLWTLLVDPLIGSTPAMTEVVPWAQALIHEELLKRGRIVRAMRFPDANDRELLNAAIRGLVALVDGALAPRWEHRRVA